MTLYCGHTFCWKCIYDYGHADNISNSPKLCPLCRKLLCREVCSRPKSEVGDLMYGNNRENQHKWGSKLLTDEQVKIECAARKISTLNLNDDSLRDNLNLFDVKTQHIALNLGASKSIMTNTSGFIAPKYGRGYRFSPMFPPSPLSQLLPKFLLKRSVYAVRISHPRNFETLMVAS